jgi:hypothetical protein
MKGRASSSGGSYTDPVLAQKIKELQKAKVHAVDGNCVLKKSHFQVENFQLAKALKASIEYLRTAAVDIGQLVLSKKQAVAKEDYDAAVLLKVKFSTLALIK